MVRLVSDAFGVGFGKWMLGHHPLDNSMIMMGCSQYLIVRNSGRLAMDSRCLIEDENK
jgi:hypothetical protein